MSVNFSTEFNFNHHLQVPTAELSPLEEVIEMTEQLRCLSKFFNEDENSLEQEQGEEEVDQETAAFMSEYEEMARFGFRFKLSSPEMVEQELNPFCLRVSSPEMVEMELKEEALRVERKQQEKMMKRRGMVSFQGVANMVTSETERSFLYGLGIYMESNYF